MSRRHPPPSRQGGPPSFTLAELLVLIFIGRSVLLALGLAPIATARAVDVHGQRFGPPRAYFTQASINKSGVVTGIRGQDNFMRFYVSPFAQTAGDAARGWTLAVLLPPALQVLPDPGTDWQLSEATVDGAPRLVARLELDPQQVTTRCIDNTWGIEHALWYRVDGLEGERFPLKLMLTRDGDAVFTDNAALGVKQALVAPPPIDPQRFRLWLHYGPLYRAGHWDELAAYLRKAGLNAVQVMAWNKPLMRAMDEQGFYVIAQRGGSYHHLYEQLGVVLDQGPAWFEKEDEGHIAAVVDHADAVIWDLEPSPGDITTDPDTLNRFRAALDLPEGQPLDESVIRERHHRAWIEFRQDEFAQAVRYWAAWSRSLKPEIETIVTEGRCNIFDPLSQIDYRKYADAVTICDPMNFAHLAALHGMLKWKAAAPEAQFAGCQNVAFKDVSPVFVSANSIMLQTLSAALIGNAGTSVYPGQTMDGENFIAWNRVMTYLGRNQTFIWESQRDPDNLLLALLPKEDVDIQLGDGRTIRHRFPDWSSDAVVHVGHLPQRNAYLASIVNWNAAEPCYGRLQLLDVTGDWMILDDENRAVLTYQGQPRIPAAVLARGVHVLTPPSDYRGYHLAPFDEAALGSYDTVAIEHTARDAAAYVDDGGTGGGATGNENVQFSYDDVNQDGQIEQVVTTPAQTLWISQAGHILKWQVGDRSLSGAGLGLGRDMLYLPTSERSNSAMDTPMRLDGRRLRDDGVRLIFSRDVSLGSLGGMVSLQLTRSIDIAAHRPQVNVDVAIKNTSLSMTVKQVPLSYRVHNHVRYEGHGDQVVWVDDGAGLTRYGLGRDTTFVSEGLSDTQADLVFNGYARQGPVRLEAFGEYFPDEQLLWSIVPRDPDELLQALRWLGARGQSGTIEWMYRPLDLPSGQVWSSSYSMSLTPHVTALDATAARQARPRVRHADANEGLLFHLDFDDRLDAAFACGEGRATVDGQPRFVDTASGRGVHLPEGAALSYPAAGNVNLQRGRLMIRFKPSWSGADGKTHELLRVQLRGGHVYLAKLADGRLLMNMFDVDEQQHYPWTMATRMPADRWHEIVVSWDAPAGRITLFLNGEKQAAHESEPWRMSSPEHDAAAARLVIPETAEAVIDGLRIWDRP